MREIRSQPRTSSATRAPIHDDRPELLLLTGSPREILARIVPEDPLGIFALSGKRLRERFLVADADRVTLRAFALCASQAPTWRGRPELGCWLAERVDEAVDQVLREEGAALELAVDPDAPAGAARRPVVTRRRDVFEGLAGPLGLDPSVLRRSALRFNLLDPSEREAFFLLAVEGRSLDDVCAERGATASALARRARRALDVLRGVVFPPALLPPAPPPPATT